MSQVDLYGVGVDALTMDDTVSLLSRLVDQGSRARVVTMNTTGLMLVEQSPFFADYVAEAELVIADGQPLVWVSSLLGKRLPERVAGIDLVDRLAADFAARSRSIFLLGAEPETVAAAAAELSRRHPRLTIAGHHHGFLDGDHDAVVDQIVTSGASALLVGMGTPHQERFIADNWDRLGIAIAIGVGGTFEVLAGRLQRAPVIFQRLGLEWLYRMAQEPSRLFGRYFATFVWLLKRTVPLVGRYQRNRRAERRFPWLFAKDVH